MASTDSDSSIVFVGESHKVQIHSTPSTSNNTTTIPSTSNNITTIPETQEQNTVPETPHQRNKILKFSPGNGTIPETQGKNYFKIF